MPIGVKRETKREDSDLCRDVVTFYASRFYVRLAGKPMLI